MPPSRGARPFPAAHSFLLPNTPEAQKAAIGGAEKFPSGRGVLELGSEWKVAFNAKVVMGADRTPPPQRVELRRSALSQRGAAGAEVMSFGSTCRFYVSMNLDCIDI
jgi:hypothetical protein